MVYPPIEEMITKIRTKIGEGWCGLRVINGSPIILCILKEKIESFLQDKTLMDYERYVKDMYLILFSENPIELNIDFLQ